MAPPPPTRSLLLSFLSSKVREGVLIRDMEVFGQIRGVELQEGKVSVHFFDVRDAQSALAELQGKHRELQKKLEQQHYQTKRWKQQQRSSSSTGVHHQQQKQQLQRGLIAGKTVWPEYTLPTMRAWLENQGTIVIFNLVIGVSDAQLKEIFQVFGPIKELRATPSKRQQRFIEFFDVRDAAIALFKMKGKEINGQSVDIQFSHPGGTLAQSMNLSANSRRTGVASCIPMIEVNVDDPRTTLIVKNIPNTYSREQVINMLDNHCISCNEKILADENQPLSAYNFVYLPLDKDNQRNLPYAFVNWTTPQAAWRFYEAVHLKKGKMLNSIKMFQVTYARLQGWEHFNNSKFACQKDDYLPVIFSPPRNGKQLTVPMALGKRER